MADMHDGMSQPAKLLLLATLFAEDRVISNNGKAWLKEAILRRDPRLVVLLNQFESKAGAAADSVFLEHIHNLIQDEAADVYNDMFSDTTLEVGKTLSKGERDLKGLGEEKSLIYGEVEFHSFYRVLRKINPQPGLIFYDLGSGTGKAVFIARFTQDFSRCFGIEILNTLHGQARIVVNRYNKEYRHLLSAGQNQHADVFAGSILDVDWMDGDVIFANSTCFDDKLMRDMAKMAEGLKPGAIFVTFTKGLNSKAFELLERKRYKMSWGPATVFIHRRLQHNGQSLGPMKLNTLPSDDIEYDDDNRDVFEKNPLRTSQPVPLSSYANEYSKKNYFYDVQSDDEDEDDEEEEEEEDDEEEEEEEEEEDEDDDEEVTQQHYVPRQNAAYYPTAPKSSSPPQQQQQQAKSSSLFRPTGDSNTRISTPPGPHHHRVHISNSPSSNNDNSNNDNNTRISPGGRVSPGPLPPPPGSPFSYQTKPSPPKSYHSATNNGNSASANANPFGRDGPGTTRGTASLIRGESSPLPYFDKPAQPLKAYSTSLLTSPSALRANEDVILAMNSPQDSALQRRKALRTVATSSSHNY